MQPGTLLVELETEKQEGLGERREAKGEGQESVMSEPVAQKQQIKDREGTACLAIETALAEVVLALRTVVRLAGWKMKPHEINREGHN
jgi:hypothetical protein